MGTLTLMVGIPGSGKSTFLEKNISHLENSIIISRDLIRFKLVKEDEEYFSKESKVFQEFVNEIRINLNKGYNVYADATHITRKSRTKLLKALNYDYKNAEIIYIDVPLDKVLARNEKRIGTRSYVPPKVIENMYKILEIPSYHSEPFKNILIRRS